ncbi:putative glycerol kinase 3-like [Planoprotostelium fungivorum]|uniref:glycerol kinase n=1 Tax=Planoprotostelium fungivorum TaxID=1890364 RepID=A0A2P6N5I7_9EUKA|nr:putative glycerol kinase 3-like [Planoprotostelium fungivorum]
MLERVPGVELHGLHGGVFSFFVRTFIAEISELSIGTTYAKKIAYIGTYHILGRVPGVELPGLHGGVFSFFVRTFITEKSANVRYPFYCVMGTQEDFRVLIVDQYSGGRDWHNSLEMTGRHIIAIDQGTSSSRCIIYDEKQKKVASKSHEFPSIHLHPGWTEQDPEVIMSSVEQCIRDVMSQTGLKSEDFRGIGITNQRETTIAWDRHTGQPLSNAIVWLDARNAALLERILAEDAKGDRDFLRAKCGLPLSTYFSAVKIRWLLENSPAVSCGGGTGRLNAFEVAEAVRQGRCCFGTVDSWIIWNLTGGTIHATDVTNASRTMLMDINSCKWDDYLCNFFGIPKETLPEIRSSAEVFGTVRAGHVLEGVKIAGVLGDQQAALVGQSCLSPGDAKNTYGTGCFMLFNTGNKPVQSTCGLLTTVAYQFGPSSKPAYALEGSVAVAGVGLKWLRDRLGVLRSFEDIDAEASKTDTTGDVYFVPAFSGLFAPYWREDARGTIVGMTQYTESCHVIRALLEAICFQTRVIADAMQKDSGQKLRQLRVDGGLTNSRVLLQIQSDLLGIPVVKPDDVEATAFGSAFAAGISTGLYTLNDTSVEDDTGKEVYHNKITDRERKERMDKWDKAVERSLDWAPRTTDIVEEKKQERTVFGYIREHAVPVVVTALLTTGVFHYVYYRNK